MLATLGTAIATTEVLEQDAAYYCEVTERYVSGHGLTSNVDRRGSLSEPVELPAAYRANTLWPLLLAPVVAVTGEARYTGSVVSLTALVAALWLATLAVCRGTGAPALLAAFCVIAALLTRKAAEVATLPLTDDVSLCVTAAMLIAVLAQRPALALLMCALAVTVRFQNVALLLPLTCLLPPGRARTRAMVGVLILASAAVLWATALSALEGIAVFLNPTHRDSLFRAIRWLSIPALAGLCVWRAHRDDSGAAVFWLLGAGHALVLLASYDHSDARGWMFAGRQGLPLHFAAAALAALALCRTRGVLRLGLFVMVCIAFGENGARPFKVMAGTHERTQRPELVLALDWLREHPLPPRSIVLSHDCDVLAYELGIGGVHLRGHDPGPALVGYLQDRGITHVLLTWWQHKHLRARNARMDEFAICTRGPSEVVVALDAPEAEARAVLLRVTP